MRLRLKLKASVICAALALGLSANASAGILSNLDVFQNNLFWIGAVNPNPPVQTQVLTFTPLSLTSSLTKPGYGWFIDNTDFSACITGLTAQIGPYGTTTVSVGQTC